MPIYAHGGDLEGEPWWDIEGDPFIETLIKFEDAITDHECNTHWLGLSEAEGRQQAARFLREMHSYQILTLSRWYGLRERQPVDPILAAGGWS